MGVATIGSNDIGDMRKFTSREQVKEHFTEVYPDKSFGAIGGRAGQAWRFRQDIKKETTTILPSKMQSTISSGR